MTLKSLSKSFVYSVEMRSRQKNVSKKNGTKLKPIPRSAVIVFLALETSVSPTVIATLRANFTRRKGMPSHKDSTLSATIFKLVLDIDLC